MYSNKERAIRFQDAREQYSRHGKQSLREVARATGLQASMLSELEDYDKSRSVGYESIIILAEYYGVSADYLLGLSDTPSVSADKKIASKVTGLTGRAVDRLRWLMKDKQIAKVFDTILGRRELTDLLRATVECRQQVREIDKTYLKLPKTIDNEASWLDCRRRLWHTKRDFSDAIERIFAVITGTSVAEENIEKALETIAKERALLESMEDMELYMEEVTDAEEE